MEYSILPLLRTLNYFLSFQQPLHFCISGHVSVVSMHADEMYRNFTKWGIPIETNRTKRKITKKLSSETLERKNKYNSFYFPFGFV